MPDTPLCLLESDVPVSPVPLPDEAHGIVMKFPLRLSQTSRLLHTRACMCSPTNMRFIGANELSMSNTRAQLRPLGLISAPDGTSHSEATQRACSYPQTHWLRYPNPAPQDSQPTCPHVIPATDTDIWSNMHAYAIPPNAFDGPTQRRPQSLLAHQASWSSFQRPARTGPTTAPRLPRSEKRIDCAV